MIIAQKLARVARMHLPASGWPPLAPRLPARQDLFNKLLASKKRLPARWKTKRAAKFRTKAQQATIALMEEIAANFSYEMIR